MNVGMKDFKVGHCYQITYKEAENWVVERVGKCSYITSSCIRLVSAHHEHRPLDGIFIGFDYMLEVTHLVGA